MFIRYVTRRLPFNRGIVNLAEGHQIQVLLGLDPVPIPFSGSYGQRRYIRLTVAKTGRLTIFAERNTIARSKRMNGP